MKSDPISTFSPSVCHEVIGLDAMILVFWMLSFKPAFPLSPFAFTITRLFWGALHGMAHSFIELDKAVVCVIRLVSFLWWWFSVCLASNLRYANDTTIMAESEELKSLLMKVKEESEKVGLKFNTHKTKIMACGPITSWQIDGETVETAGDFIFLGSKITTDDHCSREIKMLGPW